MKTSCFLDTNSAIEFLNGNPAVRAEFSRRKPAYLPFITAGELLFGAKHSGRPTINLEAYRGFLARFTIVYPDQVTLEIYSDVRLALRKMGRPIPHNDVWQAALSIQHDAALVTDDTHFKQVPGLNLENWLR